MDQKFARLIETLAPKLDELLAMEPLRHERIPMTLPTRGVYFAGLYRYRRPGCGDGYVSVRPESQCSGVSIRSGLTCLIFTVPRHGWRSNSTVRAMTWAIGRNAICGATRGLTRAESL